MCVCARVCSWEPQASVSWVGLWQPPPHPSPCCLSQHPQPHPAAHSNGHKQQPQQQEAFPRHGMSRSGRGCKLVPTGCPALCKALGRCHHLLLHSFLPTVPVRSGVLWEDEPRKPHMRPRGGQTQLGCVTLGSSYLSKPRLLNCERRQEQKLLGRVFLRTE